MATIAQLAMNDANYAASIAIFITIAQNNTGSTANNLIAQGASLQADAVPSVLNTFPL
jgi:hypothetical protein